MGRLRKSNTVLLSQEMGAAKPARNKPLAARGPRDFVPMVTLRLWRSTSETNEEHGYNNNHAMELV